MTLVKVHLEKLNRQPITHKLRILQAFSSMTCVKRHAILINDKHTTYRAYYLTINKQNINYVYSFCSYQYCIDLWRRVLEIRVDKDSVSFFLSNKILDFRFFFNKSHLNATYIHRFFTPIPASPRKLSSDL